MNIQSRVLNQAVSWLDLAHKGEISFETASLMINAFELGMAEFAEETNMLSLRNQAYLQVMDVNQYIKSLGKTVHYPKASFDHESVAKLKVEIEKIVNLRSRLTQNAVQQHININ